MIGISTAWRSKKTEDGNTLLDLMLESGLSVLELEYRITSSMLGQMRRRLRSSEFTVATVHNFCPLPDGLSRSRASGDLFLLSSSDAEERHTAVKYALKTIQLAVDLEARAVVVHLGQVEMDRCGRELRKLFDKGQIESDEARELVEKKLAERREKRQSNLDAVLLSVDRLHEEAVRLGILLGIENPFYLHQIPHSEEVGFLLEEFAGGNVRYWHDCGHAQLFELYGICDHEQWFKEHSDRLAGVHLHDTQGRRDHKAPGTGDVDFDMVHKYLSDDVIRILEVHSDVSTEAVIEGLEFLRRKGLVDAAQERH